MAKQEQSQQPQPGQPAGPVRIEDMAKRWGTLKTVYIRDMRGLSDGDGQFEVGGSVAWPRHGHSGVVHGAKLKSMDIIRDKLLLTGTAESGPLVGATLRMLVDLSNCILCFEDSEARIEVPQGPSPRVICGQPLGDVLLLVESQGGAFTAEQVAALKVAAEHPELREARPRILTALEMDAVRKAGGVAEAPGRPQEMPKVEVGAAEAEGDDAPIPAGRIESTDARDRVQVMVRGR
ncbi:MAG: hypothetical protein WC789_09335 [Lentisphaeria bacterium]